ncbi:MAG: ester cyclase [Candidatus Eremiobacteraeota bacterium]|nr:ester cyclase [Candidatus Eremiobacteraeota bacterium]
MTGFTFTREQIVSEGKWLAARGTMSGVFEHLYTHSPIGVVHPTGKPVSFELMNVFRYDDAGKLAEEWVQLENLGMLKQLGVDLTT